MTDIWDEIRQFYKDKKEEWGNESVYGSSEKRWGDKFGFTLADPYTVDEVEDYELRQHFTLPVDLKKYLTTVSRELFTHDYPHVFVLDGPVVKPCQVPVEATTTDCADGMQRISGCSCKSTIMIVVHGNHAGSVWIDDYGDMSLQTDTFMEHLTENLPSVVKLRKEKYDKWCKDNPEEAIRMFVINYNAMRIMWNQPTLAFTNTHTDHDGSS